MIGQLIKDFLVYIYIYKFSKEKYNEQLIFRAFLVYIKENFPMINIEKGTCNYWILLSHWIGIQNNKLKKKSH